MQNNRDYAVMEKGSKSVQETMHRDVRPGEKMNRNSWGNKIPDKQTQGGSNLGPALLGKNTAEQHTSAKVEMVPSCSDPKPLAGT